MPSLAQQLNADGVCVVENDVFTDPQLREDLLREASSFQEFQPGVEKFVMGGFAALGNPSSFHNMVVRNMREWAMAVVVEKLFREVLAGKSDDWKLEQKIERMTIRQPGEKPSAESFHRDLSNIKTTDEDVVLGGWINLGPFDQHFSCVLGSHRTGADDGGGFVKINTEDAKRIKKDKLSSLVVIPPGGILVFHENIVHEVLSKKLKYRMVRLHTAWRLTPGDSAMREDTKRQIDTQGIVTIKSGQTPRMYARLHWCNWPDKLVTWSIESVKPECTEVRTRRRGKRKGESFTVVHKNMDSLQGYGFKKYPAYAAEELRILHPGRSWDLLVPGNKHKRARFQI